MGLTDLCTELPPPPPPPKKKAKIDHFSELEKDKACAGSLGHDNAEEVADINPKIEHSSELEEDKARSSEQDKADKDADVLNKYKDKVFTADCLKFMRRLPSDVLDCTITSPPYNKGGLIFVYHKFSDDLPWDKYIDNQIAVLNELYRITKPGGHLWYVHQVQPRTYGFFHPIKWIQKTPWTVRQEIIWGRAGNAHRMPYRFQCKEERIYWLRKEPGPAFELSPEVAKWGNVWVRPHTSASLSRLYPHPCKFPLYLVLAIIHVMNLPTGSLIFDPYGGTGTAAKASQVSNHHYLTVEIDKHYVRMIRDRLRTTEFEDEWWITVMMKQIADGTLDLSQNLKKLIQEKVLCSTFLEELQT